MVILPPATRLFLAIGGAYGVFLVHVFAMGDRVQRGEWEGWQWGALLTLAFGFALTAVLWGKPTLLRAARFLCRLGVLLSGVVALVGGPIGCAMYSEELMTFALVGFIYVFVWAVFLAAVQERQAQQASFAENPPLERRAEPEDDES
jgi:hypothetical protein